jgi:hypothetical protein
MIRIMKSRRIRWAGNVARMGRIGMRIGFWWESRMEIDHREYLEVGGRIVLRWILERQDGVVWTGLIWLRKGTIGGPL